MSSFKVYFWKKAPFLRFLLPLMAGIAVQWQFQFPVQLCWYLLLSSLVIVTSFFFIPFFERYKLTAINGIFVFSLFFSIGALLTWHDDIRHDKQWMGNLYHDQDALIVSLKEPLEEKNKSFKADATTEFLIQDQKKTPVNGKIIIYFEKDSSLAQLVYGSQILFKKSLQPIKNSGNPGGFDYERYCLFHKITHQVYLKPGEFLILKGNSGSWFQKFLYSIREKVVSIIRKYIPGEKEQGLAEALLIGYKDDLDKNLVQSYTNTGVVHIIAISGLHLGLIYWLLIQLLKPLKRKKYTRWLRPILIIAGLWLFSLLAGGQASVVRSAVMFTCIVLGESFSKNTSIYNTLAFSAFLLLCYNPYWLWDVGFQLSFAAVLSIVIFMRPIYNLFYVKNKILDFIWKLNAVSLAAQLLTTPISIYHFHQFPSFFLLTNFVAVPLASIILIGEIFLCIISFIPFIAVLAGKLLSGLIRTMNTYIERIESLPYSLWDGLQTTIFQTILLLIIVAGMGFWLMEKSKNGLKIGLAALLGFIALRSYSFIEANRQQKIIVYNVPKQRAIDVIDGRKYVFIGDSSLLEDDFLRNFHLKPSRILNRIAVAPAAKDVSGTNKYFLWRTKKIMMINKATSFNNADKKIDVDLLVISKNPKINISKLAHSLNIKQIVFDGSASYWRLNQWKKDCDSFNIPYYDVKDKGAFVMNVR